MEYNINEVSKLCGMSIRTLHYYDQIGLLKVKKNDNGYRKYNDNDLETLQQIMFYKELDFSLKEIKDIINNKNFNRLKALEEQFSILIKKAKKYEELAILAINTAEKIKRGEKMDNKELFKEFNYEEMVETQKGYEDEVTNRWGASDAYKISKKRTKSYSKEDWEKIHLEQQENMKLILNCFNNNLDIKSNEVKNAVEANRLFIDKNFYPCSKEFFLNLGEMYIGDERFKKTYDDLANGLAKYYSDAIKYHCK